MTVLKLLAQKPDDDIKALGRPCDVKLDMSKYNYILVIPHYFGHAVTRHRSIPKLIQRYRNLIIAGFKDVTIIGKDGYEYTFNGHVGKPELYKSLQPSRFVEVIEEAIAC